MPKTKAQIGKMSKKFTDKIREMEKLFDTFYDEIQPKDPKVYIEKVNYIKLYDPWDAYRYGLYNHGTTMDYIIKMETSSRVTLM